MRLNFRAKTHKNKGFTLIEVIFSLFILFIVLTGFVMFSMSAYQKTMNIMTKTIAQNLAQITMEDIRAQTNSILEDIINGKSYFNYPTNGTIYAADGSVTHETPYFDPTYNVYTTYHVVAQGQFLIDKIDRFFTAEPLDPNVTNDSYSTHENVAGIGYIPELETAPYSNYITKVGPVTNDYVSLYTPEQLADNSSSNYQVYKYKITEGIYVEPMKKTYSVSGENQWDSGLIIFKSNFPNFLREITITDRNPEKVDLDKKEYAIDVKIIWTFNTYRQMVEITGLKTNVN